jgi:hypothetical protein
MKAPLLSLVEITRFEKTGGVDRLANHRQSIPRLLDEAADRASEGPRRDVACTKDVPPRFVTAPAIAGEAMQFAVRRDELGRRKSSLSDGGQELI